MPPDRSHALIVGLGDAETEDRPAAWPLIAGTEVATARRYADASRALSTQRAYAADWRRFAAWCLARDITTLPADPRAVAVFLSAEAEGGSAPLTIGRRLAAIGWMHRRAGLQPPQAREGAAAILEVMAGIRRTGAGSMRRRAPGAIDGSALSLAGSDQTGGGPTTRVVLAAVQHRLCRQRLVKDSSY